MIKLLKYLTVTLTKVDPESSWWCSLGASHSRYIPSISRCGWKIIPQRYPIKSYIVNVDYNGL